MSDRRRVRRACAHHDRRDDGDGDPTTHHGSIVVRPRDRTRGHLSIQGRVVRMDTRIEQSSCSTVNVSALPERCHR